MASQQKHFPQKYSFEALLKSVKGFESLNTLYAEQFTPYGNYDQYLASYTLLGDALAALIVPTLIIAAEDDPLCPATDLHNLVKPATLTLDIQPHGGHCGFIESWNLHGFAERWLKNGVIRALDELQ